MKTRILAIAALAVVGAGVFALKPVVALAKGGETFSHSFRQASADQVIAWMGQQGIQIKVDRSLLPSGPMTFAFQGLDRDTLVETFGQMVGMNAEKRGNVYSLMRGVGGDGPAEYLGSEGRSDCPLLPGEDQEKLKQELEFFAPMEGFAFDMGQQDMKGLVDEIMKSVEESGAKLNDAQKEKLRKSLTEKIAKMHSSPFMFAPGEGGMKFFTGPEGTMKVWGPDREQAMKEHMKALEEMQKDGRFKMLQGDEAMKSAQDAIKMAIERLQATREQKNLTEEQKGAIDQALKELKKAMEQKTWLMPGGEGTWVMPGGMEFFKSGDYQKAMEEMHKHMAELEKNGVLKQWNSDEFKKHMEDMQKELGENGRVLKFKFENIKKFISTLTPKQKELADKQGFLRPSDLTPEQRELLGIGTDGEMNLTFEVDGQKITIKNKDKEEKKGVITA